MPAEGEVVNHNDAHFELMLDIQKRLVFCRDTAQVLACVDLCVLESPIDGKIDCLMWKWILDLCQKIKA